MIRIFFFLSFFLLLLPKLEKLTETVVKDRKKNRGIDSVLLSDKKEENFDI